ncbi:serine protease inhibitor dipetalogastin-like [Cydia pomonella]|uniref:serine protease inhibitor dipetalogastin-like n=1 Tax=Cydia pomonella TaxID=82600 RepID=UPI002ADDD6AE|nr:serine protease inhibitor dipetalogastin-like [Cydia pomonella]
MLFWRLRRSSLYLLRANYGRKSIWPLTEPLKPINFRFRFAHLTDATRGVMERILVFVCISSLVVTFHITTGRKLSLRQGPPQEEPPGPIVITYLKNCTMCPRHYKPVCASNGHWYHNPCFMACEVGDNSSVSILYEGMCRPKHMDDRIIETTEPPENMDDQIIETTEPPENMDDRIIETTESPEKMHARIIETTEPTKETCANSCPGDYIPVCASNLKWYSNTCLMECDNAKEAPDKTYCTATIAPLVVEEHYRADCNCSMVYDPVCMDDGKWYYNICMMECITGYYIRKEMINYYGKCIQF